MKLTYRIFSLLLLLVGLSSCQNELDIKQPDGGLLVKLNHVSTAITTRATPAELGKPAAEKFNLLVVDKAHGMTKYDGKVTDQTIPLAGGDYTVTASYGENPIAGIDAPYYIGTQQVTVVQEEVTEVSLECKVGNALISVIFGANEDDRTRLAKFYKSCGVRVKVDGYMVDLPSTAAGMSAYFRAGSTPELEFYGVLAGNDQQVSTTLTTPKDGILPSPFQAADHAIVTLTLPDPESVTVLDISKVEIVEATMEETIPLSWLPIPQATAEHQYDDKGDLVGTDITFTNCYPGMEWKAVVTDAQNTVYRTVQGKGNLTTSYADDANMTDWPYIPAGSYKAVYYVIAENQEGKEEKLISSREFTVGSPDKLKVSLSGGYTSYTKYVTEGAAAANACNASTLNPPSATLNVSNSILSNGHYASLKCNYTAQVDNNTHGSTQSVNSNTCTWDNVNNLAPRAEEYIYSVTATFDGGSATTKKGDFFITGLPASYAPPKGEQGWRFTAGGNCSFESNYMKLATTVSPTPKAQSPSYYCPTDVDVVVTSSASQNTGLFNYTYTLHFAGSGSDVENTTSRGNAKTFVNNGTLKAGEDYLITEYSYIAAGNYLQIFSLTVQYR